MSGNVEPDFKVVGRENIFTPGEILEAVREDHDRLQRLIEEIRERVNRHGEGT
jgi:hypothetical protein